MYIVMCLDDDNGVLFNNRRQSRDAKVSADIFKTSKGRLFISEYSKTLFKRFEGVTVGEEFPYCAEDGDYCFAECEVTKDAAEKAEGFIILSSFSPIRLRVRSLRGAWMDTISDSARSCSSGRHG